MAIAHDTSTAHDPGTVASGTSFSHTCTGSNRLLLVGVQSAVRSDLAVTYNGVSMTKLASYEGTTVNNYMFGLLAPASGSNSVAITWTGADQTVRVVASSYTGVLQSGFPDATKKTETTTGESLTGTITTVADNCWSAVWAFQLDGTAITASTNVTNRQTIDTFDLFGDSNAAISPAGNFDQTVTWTTSSSLNRMIQVSFAPVPTAAGGNPLFFSGGVTIG